MPAPLHGVRVLDLTHALAGPFCTHQLALMGAEVIKVESPKGDEFRDHPIVFYAANAGKRSVVIDLKTEAGRRVLDRLIARSDVLVENFRPGTAAALGLEWNRLREFNSRLIFCSISGYGQAGPLKNMPATEFAVQAASGLMSHQLPASEHPRKVPMVMLDPLTGYVAHAAIMGALLQRHQTQLGQRLDVAMIDAALMLMSTGVVELQEGVHGVLGGREGVVGRPTVGRFMAADHPLFISAVQPVWWQKVCETIGRPDLVADPRFDTLDNRFANADVLMAEWEDSLGSRPADEWEAMLSGVGVPVARVRSLSEFIEHPHVARRGNIIDVQVPGREEPVRVVGAGARAEVDHLERHRSVPELGADTTDVLAETGLSEAEIAALTSDGITVPRGRG